MVSGDFENRKNVLFEIFKNYLNMNNKLYLQGFITFRIRSYIDKLEQNIEEAVNGYLIDKEYLELLDLLKLYIQNEESKIDIVHLVYNEENPTLFDKDKNKINTDIDLLKTKYLSDISFSSADMILNTLLNLIPKQIYIYLLNNDLDDFINTLKVIFRK